MFFFFFLSFSRLAALIFSDTFGKFATKSQSKYSDITEKLVAVEASNLNRIDEKASGKSVFRLSHLYSINPNSPLSPSIHPCHHGQDKRAFNALHWRWR